MMAMNWIDYVFIGVLLLSCVIGLVRGFLREVISLVAMVLAVLLALKLAVVVSELVSWSTPGVRYVVAFIAIFLLVLLVGMLLGRCAKTMASTIGLGIPDHILGVVFGFSRGAIVIVMAVLLLNMTALTQSAWYRQSVTIPTFQVAAKWLDGFLPHTLQTLSSWMNPPVQHIDSNALQRHAATVSHHINRLRS